jgi:hypothetical protein
MNQLTRYLRRHHIALLALFVALGGTSYAAVSLPKASVGTDQLKARSVSTLKVQPGAITSKRLENGSVARKKIRDGAVNSKKVANGSLLAEDLAAGVLPTTTPPSGPAGGSLSGTYPNPGIAAGAVGPDQIGEIPAVRLIRGSGSTFEIATGGQGTPIAWPAPTGAPNDRSYDIGGFVNPPNTPGQCLGQVDTCIVFPRTGTYAISAGARWTVVAGGQDNGTGYRALRIHGLGGRQSGTTSSPALTNTQTIQSVTTIDRYNAGEAAFVSASQDSGVPLNIAGSLQQVYFAATWLGP